MGTWFDDVWNKATGVFDTVIDFETTKFESRLAYDQQAWERENARATAPVNSNWAAPKSDLLPWILGAVVLGGGIILLKK